MSGRAYDALYDVSYTVSGARDHYREQTMSGGFSVERAPVYNDMFSVLPHHPASSYRFKNRDKVPAFVDRTFHASQPSTQERATINQPDAVAGNERFKYFRRPMLAAPDPVIIKQGTIPPPPPVPPPAEVLRSRTVGTQSDYRENETQTTPWEPDVVLAENPSVKQQALSAKYNCSGPELLALKDLKFSDGLPPGLQEVRRIDKMREKRAFEASLPPLHDVEKLPIRQKMIEEWEKMEWADREEEILGVQEERLALLEQALIAREGDVDDVTARRVEDRKTTMLQDRADKFASIQAGRIKTMRHLSEARKYVEKPRKLHKLSVIEKYADFGSSAYAPMQRDGKVTQRLNIETEGFQPVSLQGLDELEAYLPPRLLNPLIGVPQKPLKLDYQQRKEAGIQSDLKSINDLLDTAKATKGRGIGDAWPAPLGKDAIGTTLAIGADLVALKHQQQVAEKKQQQQRSTIRSGDRPDTAMLPPSVTPASAKEAAAILLQSLLRGRAAQNAMHEGKVRRQALILELLQEIPRDPKEDLNDSDAADIAMGDAFSLLLSSLVSDDPSARANSARAVFASALVDLSDPMPPKPAHPTQPAFTPAPPTGPKSGSSRPVSATYAMLGSIVDEIAAEVEAKVASSEPIPEEEEGEEALLIAGAEPIPVTATEEAIAAEAEEAIAATEEPTTVVEAKEAVAFEAVPAEKPAVVEAEEGVHAPEEAAVADSEDAVAFKANIVQEEAGPSGLVAEIDPVAEEVEPSDEAATESKPEPEASSALSILEDKPTTGNEEKAPLDDDAPLDEDAKAATGEEEEAAFTPEESEAKSSPLDITPASDIDNETPARAAEEAVVDDSHEASDDAPQEVKSVEEEEATSPIGSPIGAEPSIGTVLRAVDREDLIGEASFAGGLLGGNEDEVEAEEDEEGTPEAEGEVEGDGSPHQEAEGEAEGEVEGDGSPHQEETVECEADSEAKEQ